jgi:hemin uptake protein HemP
VSRDRDVASAALPLAATAMAPRVEPGRVAATASTAAAAGSLGAKPPVRPVASEALFAGASEVHIDHRGTLYRLKQTALGKLILTK